eukprot:7624445-Lingulodinium_polyedra.AAC.1
MAGGAHRQPPGCGRPLPGAAGAALAHGDARPGHCGGGPGRAPRPGDPSLERWTGSGRAPPRR